MKSTKGFFSLFKQAVVDLKEVQVIHQAVNQNSIPPVVQIELCKTAAPQKNLCFFQRESQTKTQTDDPAAGGIAASGKDLVQVHFAHTGILCENRFLDSFLCHDLFQKLHNAFQPKLCLIFFQKIVQIGSLFHFSAQIVGAFRFQCGSAFPND